jgi:hypothetical protein
VGRRRKGLPGVTKDDPPQPGIHNHDWGLWIPGLRQEAHPGMTVLRYQRDATAVSLSKLASSACNVVSVEWSATPSTRAGRKWR